MYLLYILVCAYSMPEHTYILYVLHSVHVYVCVYVRMYTYVISPSWSLHRELMLFVGYVRLSLRCSTRGDINNM